METIRELKRICGKPAHSYKAKFYRWISYYLTWVLLQFGLTANQVSLLGVVVGLLSALLFITNNYILFTIASLLLFISVLIDYCDGEVARYRKYHDLPDELFRKHGGFFDSLNHVSIPFVFLCMSFSFIGYHPLVLGIGLLSTAFRLLDTSFYNWLKPVILLFSKNFKKHKRSNTAKEIRSLMYSALAIPFMLLFTSVVDLYCNCGLTFLLWIFFFFIGGLLFLLEISHKSI